MKLSDRVSLKKKPKVKYPTKTTMNLAVRETTDNSPSRVVPVFVVLVLVVVLFAKFGVIDRYSALNRAQSALDASQSRLTEMNKLLTGYDQVAARYHAYSTDYLTDSQKLLADRLDLLDMLDTHLNGLATLESVSIVDNSMVVKLSAADLAQISALRLALLQESCVQSVSVYTAATGQTSTSGSVEASMVIAVSQTDSTGGTAK